jgi:hypothetical protein
LFLLFPFSPNPLMRSATIGVQIAVDNAQKNKTFVWNSHIFAELFENINRPTLGILRIPRRLRAISHYQCRN